MSVFYVTFPTKYARENHPRLGHVPDLPNGWLEVRAVDERQARALTYAALGEHWAFMYDSLDGLMPDYYPRGRIGCLMLGDDELARLAIFGSMTRWLL